MQIYGCYARETGTDLNKNMKGWLLVGGHPFMTFNIYNNKDLVSCQKLKYLAALL